MTSSVCKWMFSGLPRRNGARWVQCRSWFQDFLSRLTVLKLASLQIYFYCHLKATAASDHHAGKACSFSPEAGRLVNCDYIFKNLLRHEMTCCPLFPGGPASLGWIYVVAVTQAVVWLGREGVWMIQVWTSLQAYLWHVFCLLVMGCDLSFSSAVQWEGDAFLGPITVQQAAASHLESQGNLLTAENPEATGNPFS